MSLTNYKVAFDNAYQEIFQKVLVAKDVMNTRFESVLKYGGTVTRFSYDISNVRVRNVVRGADSTIDSIVDSSDSLVVNVEKEAAFYISDGEVTQTGPYNPGEVIGSQVAIKVAVALDALCFAQVPNASLTFDTGDLTTLSSTSAEIVLSSTTVPQMVTRMPAKLKHFNNQILSNMVFVVDSYAGADIAQYLLGKQFDIVDSVFKNGYSGDISTAKVYVSENLMGQAKFTASSAPADGDIIIIGGVTFTAKTTLSTGPAIAGEVLIGGSASAFHTNFTAALNAPSTTTANFTALSAANALIITDQLNLATTATATTTVIKGTGSGRMVISKTSTNITITNNFFHAYFGKRGAIDLVVQDMSEVDMRPTSTKRGTNVFSSFLAGLKTFPDGAKKFLDVWIAA